MSLFSVAKFLAKTARTRSQATSRRAGSSDSTTLAGDDVHDKIPGPLPAPVATETIIHAEPEFSKPPSSPPSILSRKSTDFMRKFEPSASKLPPPVVDSRTHSDAPSSAPTESYFTPQTENPEHSSGIGSSSGGDMVPAVTEEPEPMTKAEVPSPAEPEHQVESIAEKKVESVTEQKVEPIAEKEAEEAPQAVEQSPPAPVEEEVKVNPQDLEMEKYRGELRALSSQIEDALKEVHQYKSELFTSAEEKLSLLSDIQAYKAELVTSAEKQDSLRNEVQAYEAELVTSAEGKEALLKEIQAHKDDLNTSSLVKESLREELEKSKAVLSVISEEKAGFREDVAIARAELEEASRARNRLNSQIQNLKEELRNTLNVVDDKTSLIDRLLAEVGNLKDNIRIALIQKEEVGRLAEREREYMEERFNSEKEDFIHAATEDREEARREVTRLKGLIAVERHSHKERHRDVSQEKDDLLVKLESEQSRVASLLLQVECYQDRINGLEVHLEDSREETRELYNKHNEQETKIRQMEEDLLEERDRLGMKDSQIHFLETTKESLETALVQLQTKASETNRQNDMFQEQIRQQADQLQHRAAHPNQPTSTYGYGYSDAFGAGIGRFMASTATLSAFSSFTRGLRRGATNTRAEAGVKALKLLNDEIYQLAASLTDQLESVNKRFVPDDSALPASSTISTSLAHTADGVRRAKAEYLKSTLGLELINKLESDASQEMEDINPFFLQVALQGSLTACCMRIITSWYPSEWEYGSFLETLYERIRGTGGIEAAMNWRKTTQQNCSPSVPRDRNTKLVDYLVEDLQAVLTISGWSKESDADSTIEAFRQKLFNIVSMAVRMNTLTAIGVPGELEPIMSERGNLFDSKKMVDDSAPDRSKSTDIIPKDEIVIAVVGLGLKWAEHSEIDMPLLVMKPRVVLDSALA